MTDSTNADSQRTPFVDIGAQLRSVGIAPGKGLTMAESDREDAKLSDAQRTTPGGVPELPADYRVSLAHWRAEVERDGEDQAGEEFVAVLAIAEALAAIHARNEQPARSSLPPTQMGDIIEIDENGRVTATGPRSAQDLRDMAGAVSAIPKEGGDLIPANSADTQVASQSLPASLPPDFGKLMTEYGEAVLMAAAAKAVEEKRRWETGVPRYTGLPEELAENAARAALEAAIASLGKCSVCRGTGKCVAGPGACICGDGSAAGELRYLHDTGARQAIALHGASLGSAEEMRERAARAAEEYARCANPAVISNIASDIRALASPGEKVSHD